MTLFEYLAMLQFVQINLCVFEKYDQNENSTLDALEVQRTMTFYGYVIEEKQRNFSKKKELKKVKKLFLFSQNSLFGFSPEEIQ